MLPGIYRQPLHLAGVAVEQILEHAPRPVLEAVLGGDGLVG